MTAYGFDLDGTLTRPALAQLANDLFDAGHEVWVVTGGLADSGEWTMKARKEKLASLGVRCTGIVRCISPDAGRIGDIKGKWCEGLGLSVFADDSASYMEGVGRESGVTRLLVLPLREVTVEPRPAWGYDTRKYPAYEESSWTSSPRTGARRRSASATGRAWKWRAGARAR